MKPAAETPGRLYALPVPASHASDRAPALNLPKEVRNVAQISLPTALLVPDVDGFAYSLEGKQDIGDGVPLVRRNHILIICIQRCPPQAPFAHVLSGCIDLTGPWREAKLGWRAILLLG